MLTIHEPIKITAARPFLTFSVSFENRISAGYRLLECHITAQQLLHLAFASPEWSYAEEHNFYAISDVMNRILLEEKMALTYQDRAYITVVLHKLGVKDARSFMGQVRRVREEYRNLERLMGLYWEQQNTLREIDTLMSEREREKEGISLDRNIYKRLDTRNVYEEAAIFQKDQVNGNRSFRHEEFQTAEQRWVSHTLFLAELKEEVLKKGQILLRHENPYEKKQEYRGPVTKERMAAQLSSALLLNLISFAGQSRFEQYDSEELLWLDFTPAVRQTSKDTLERFEYYHQAGKRYGVNEAVYQAELAELERKEVELISSLVSQTREIQTIFFSDSAQKEEEQETGPDSELQGGYDTVREVELQRWERGADKLRERLLQLYRTERLVLQETGAVSEVEQSWIALGAGASTGAEERPTKSGPEVQSDGAERLILADSVTVSGAEERLILVVSETISGVEERLILVDSETISGAEERLILADSETISGVEERLILTDLKTTAGVEERAIQSESARPDEEERLIFAASGTISGAEERLILADSVTTSGAEERLILTDLKTTTGVEESTNQPEPAIRPDEAKRLILADSVISSGVKERLILHELRTAAGVEERPVQPQSATQFDGVERSNQPESETLSDGVKRLIRSELDTISGVAEKWVQPKAVTTADEAEGPIHPKAELFLNTVEVYKSDELTQRSDSLKPQEPAGLQLFHGQRFTSDNSDHMTRCIYETVSQLQDIMDEESDGRVLEEKDLIDFVQPEQQLIWERKEPLNSDMADSSLTVGKEEKTEFSVLRQYLDQINEKNRMRLETVDLIRNEDIQSVESFTVDMQRTREDSLKALENPLEILEKIRSLPEINQDGNKKKQTETMLKVTDDTTRYIYEQVIHYCENGSGESENVRPATQEQLMTGIDLAMENRQQAQQRQPESLPMVYRQMKTGISDEMMEKLSSSYERKRVDVQTEKTVQKTVKEIKGMIEDGITKQIGQISDQVCQRLERKLKNEQARRGR